MPREALVVILAARRGGITDTARWRFAASRDPAWHATVGVRNVTDEQYIVSGFASPAQGPITVRYGRQREWFLTVGVDL